MFVNWNEIIKVKLTVCSYHVTYAFQGESTIYSCVNVKGLLARNWLEGCSLSDCNCTWTHDHLVRKLTINHLVNLVWLNGWVFVYKLRLRFVLWVWVQFQSIKVKTDNKKVNFSPQFCIGSISNGSSASEFREISLNRNVYDLSVDYNSLGKSDILNIHKFPMTKNNIKSCLTCFCIIKF